ncbi:hypothetical protein MAR_029152 [Mya arenaria]|uniref:Uncharacterized protein n=1 Tax=Mya arenaria TaxID=6604 RepID=A0ABY7DFN0_MYAAR|nr:hypothetical protein MAR_029152 [Mya arenaria]
MVFLSQRIAMLESIKDVEDYSEDVYEYEADYCYIDNPMVQGCAMDFAPQMDVEGDGVEVYDVS